MRATGGRNILLRLYQSARSALLLRVLRLLVAVVSLAATVTNFHLGPQGRKAKEIISAARENLAKMIGGKPQELIFTSGGTEVRLSRNRVCGGSCAGTFFLFKILVLGPAVL